MKKLFAIVLLTGFFTACNDNAKSGEDTPTAPVTPGIDNVNGNVPDTTETIRLNNPLPTDSVADTTGRR